MQLTWKRSIATVFSALAHDLYYQRRSRHLWILAGICGVAGSLIAFGAVATARSAIATFRSEKLALEAEGDTLADALSRPLGLTNDGVTEVSDNPLRYFWEKAGRAAANVEPVGNAINSMETVTFLLLPALFFSYGVMLAVRDIRHRTLKVTVVQFGRTAPMLAQVVSVVRGALAAAVGGLGISWGVSLGVWQFAKGQLDFTYLAPPPTPTLTTLLATMLATLGVGTFFGMIGLSTGLITRRAIPLVVGFLAFNFLVPIMSVADPRNLVLVIATEYLDFHGSFRPGTVVSVSVGAALALMAAWCICLAVAAWAVTLRRGAYTR
jgi:hypothetical protein